MSAAVRGEGGREEERESERERERERRRKRERERNVSYPISSLFQLTDHIRGSYQTDRFWSLKDRSCEL